MKRAAPALPSLPHCDAPEPIPYEEDWDEDYGDEEGRFERRSGGSERDDWREEMPVGPFATVEQASAALDVPVESIDEYIVDRPWGGTGDSCVVCRLLCKVPTGTLSVICKRVLGPSRRHEENAAYAIIKSMSYKVELGFLLNNQRQGIARCLLSEDYDDSTSLLLLEDLLEVGYPYHVTDLTLKDASCALSWLADFHKSSCPNPDCLLWRRGGYWALDKRNRDLAFIEDNWIRLMEAEEFMHACSPSLGCRLALSAEGITRVLFPHVADLQLPAQEDDREKLRALLLVRCGEVALKEPRRMENSVLLHGDFKAENVFFTKDLSSMAAIDFQWTGFGVGAIDVFGLLSSSLGPEDCLSGPHGAENEKLLLSDYATAFGGSLEVLKYLFDLTIVDFCRFIVGTGDVFEEDLWLLLRADSVLRGLERKCPASGPGSWTSADYAEAVRKNLQEVVGGGGGGT